MLYPALTAEYNVVVTREWQATRKNWIVLIHSWASCLVKVMSTKGGVVGFGAPQGSLSELELCARSAQRLMLLIWEGMLVCISHVARSLVVAVGRCRMVRWWRWYCRCGWCRFFEGLLKRNTSYVRVRALPFADVSDFSKAEGTREAPLHVKAIRGSSKILLSSQKHQAPQLTFSYY